MDKTEIQILLLEDNTADVIFLREALEEDLLNSFSITTVERLASAINLIQKKTFDAILLDLGLPDSQGLETFTRIHQAVPDIPTVILSGLRDERFAQQAMHAGAQDYLMKDSNSFASAARSIRYAIERQRAQKKPAPKRRTFSNCACQCAGDGL